MHTDLVEHPWFKENIDQKKKFENVIRDLMKLCVSEKIKEVFEKTYGKEAIVRWNQLIPI